MAVTLAEAEQGHTAWSRDRPLVVVGGDIQIHAQTRGTTCEARHLWQMQTSDTLSFPTWPIKLPGVLVAVLGQRKHSIMRLRERLLVLAVRTVTVVWA